MFSSQEWQECKKIPGCDLSFIIDGDHRLVCENEEIKSHIPETADMEEDDDDANALRETAGICLVTGERGRITRLNPRTPIGLAQKVTQKLSPFRKIWDLILMGKNKALMHLSANLHHLHIQPL